MVVYKVTNRLNGKVYIGQTRGTIEARWKQHICRARHQKGRLQVLYLAIRKYGEKAFDIEAIDSANTIEELNTKEWFFASMLNSYAPNGYNLRECGDGALSHPSTIAKRSKTYRLLSPDNVIHEITNLSLFCESRGLDRCHMYRVASGVRQAHKGWRRAASESVVRVIRNAHTGQEMEVIEAFGAFSAMAKRLGVGREAFGLLMSGRTKRLMSGWYVKETRVITG